MIWLHEGPIIYQNAAYNREKLTIIWLLRKRLHQRNRNVLFRYYLLVRLVKRITFKKRKPFHLFIHCFLLIFSPFYKVTCYRRNWVYSVRAVQDIVLRARDLQEHAYFSQSVRWSFHYFHARDV